jgi:uncharacterized protein
MSARKESVERYCEGFRRGDRSMVLDCLTDDVTWYLPGYTTLQGKAAFDGEIENPAFRGQPTLVVTKLVEETDAVVAVGEGAAARADGAPFRFAFCDVFRFVGDRIDRVESYVVPLTG